MKCRRLLLLLALTARLSGQEVSVPERPADHVLDQTGKVTVAERRAVQAEMELAAEKAGLSIYLVFLNSAAEEPPADVARRLAQAWEGSTDRVIVLTAPDITPPIIVAVLGDSFGALPEADLLSLTETAMAAGQRAAPGLTAMLETARSVISQVLELRRHGQPGARSVPSPAVASDAPAGNPGAWIAGGSLACCLLALILMRRGRRSALIFPVHEFRHRFSAPHSGGNDAMVPFGK